jgi:hypothetical protein
MHQRYTKFNAPQRIDPPTGKSYSPSS